MLIREIHVKNYRSIVDETLPCDSLTALVGKNGSGKSSFLKALELFYDSSPTVSVEDFYNEDTTQDIEITVTFGDLTPEAESLFAPYIQGTTLTVSRVFSLSGEKISHAYHGMRLQNPAFLTVRSAGGARDKISAYRELRSSGEFPSLPAAQSSDAVMEAMEAWEAENPEECEPMRDSGQFFGFQQVGQGYLGRFTQFISIPAVRDAQTDATEGRGSSVTQIMDLVVRSVLSNRQDVVDFRRSTQEQYNSIMDPSKLRELSGLSESLSQTLQAFIPDTSVSLTWSPLPAINVPLPQAQVKLIEDSHVAAVDRTGHGLQRAFIVTMLQHLAAAKKQDGEGGDKDTSEDEGEGDREATRLFQLPNLVLAIEEPELYQHPSRQRHLASVFLNLATGGISGVADSTQILYTTHSPLFAGLDRFDQIRVLYKVTKQADAPKVTQLKRADMEAVAVELGSANHQPPDAYRADTLRPRLHAIMTPWMGEGFFADVVVLVEGEDDRAAILGFAEAKGQDFDSMGIAVIPCFGKHNLDRPLVIFRRMNIPTFVVWDGDSDSTDPKPQDNKYLLRLLDLPEEDWPCFVSSTAACFKKKLEKTLQAEIGAETFNRVLSSAQEAFGVLKKDHALKNPAVIQRIVKESSNEGQSSQSLEKIVENIVALATNSESPQEEAEAASQ